MMTHLKLVPPPTESPHGKCPDDYEDFGTPDYCYKLKTVIGSNFDNALTSCFYDGGHVASIHNEALNNVLHAEVKKLDEKFWIGLFYRENEIRKRDFPEGIQLLIYTDWIIFFYRRKYLHMGRWLSERWFLFVGRFPTIRFWKSKVCLYE